MSAVQRRAQDAGLQLGEALGELTDHYLLMTATPHKATPRTSLCSWHCWTAMLYGDVKSLEEAMRRAEAPFYLRRIKAGAGRLPRSGYGRGQGALYEAVRAHGRSSRWPPTEWDFYIALTRYVEEQSVQAAADDSARGRALGFTMAMLAAAVCGPAFTRSVAASSGCAISGARSSRTPRPTGRSRSAAGCPRTSTS